jgi:amidase
MTEFWRKPATDLAQLVRIGAASATEITEDALARLDAVNPAINAVVQFMPRRGHGNGKGNRRGSGPGRPSAAAGRRAGDGQGQCRPEGFATTNGLRIQKDLVAEQDSPVVANLRKAGAIIIGRTNTPAFSLHWFCRNSLHGHTKNPLNPAITPGGSSGGAAAATAAGIGAIGHGTDIAGSIRYPAYACGLHGLRPTLGRVPAVNFSGPDRHIGAQLMAVSGPLARTIADVRAGYEAMAGEDLRDPWWVPVPHDLPDQPKRAALCVSPDGLKVEAPVADALRAAASKLADAGWEVEEVNCPPLQEPARLQAAFGCPNSAAQVLKPSSVKTIRMQGSCMLR